MFSRCNLAKNVDKYFRTLKIFKEKWSIKRKYNIKLINKYTSAVTTEKYNNSSENKKQTAYGLYLSKYSQSVSNPLQKLSFQDRILLSSAGITVVAENAKPAEVLEPIPEPPSIFSQEVLESISSTGEPAFETLGLGGWSPVGIVQNCLEYLHIGLDIPWWGAIVIGTICVRVLMFPLVIIAQRNGAKMNNYLPQLQVLQLKMTEARQTGNQLDAARYGQEMITFMKEKQLNPLKNMLVPLAQNNQDDSVKDLDYQPSPPDNVDFSQNNQDDSMKDPSYQPSPFDMPLFVSFFIGLRQMANCPVESMQHGGLFWFTDLTLPDQFFILPIITSLTMWATIEVGTDTAKLSAQNLQMMKYVLRAMPVVILPFTVNFPGAILCYWVCTNFISLGQVGVLRIPAVRDFFKIEPLITHNPDKLPIKNKGFVSGMKDSWTNMKISSEIEGRRRYDEMQFQRAGKGPIIKTYKFDPTKQNAPVYSAKKST